MSNVPQINVNVVDGLPEAPQDDTTYGRRNAAWVDMTAPANLQVNRGSTAEVAAYTPLDGEPVWDNESKLLYIGDGQTQGGIAVGSTVAVNAPLVSDPTDISTNTYTKPLSVTLLGNNSVWQVSGSMTFVAADAIGGDLQFDLPNPGGTILRSVVHIFQTGNNTIATAPGGAVTLNTLDDQIGEVASVAFDYIIRLGPSASPLTWGVPVRSTTAASAGYIAGDAGGFFSAIYARRLV